MQESFSIEVNKNNVYALFGKAEILASLGQVVDAMDVLEKAIRLNPSVKSEARKAENLASIRESERFKKLVSE